MFELLQNTEEEIRSLAAFLNVSLSDAQLESLVRFTSLDSMRGYFGQPAWQNPFYKTDVKLFRKGQIGKPV